MSRRCSGSPIPLNVLGLLDLLDRYRPTLEAELESHLVEHRSREAADLGQRALRIGRDILDLDEFSDLALPGGLAKRQRPARKARAPKARDREATRPRRSTVNSGDREAPDGRRIRYEEVPFENGSTAHSRFASGVVQTNTLHPDYIQATRTAEGRLAYAALMIGKETIAFNDRSGAAGDFLEKLLDFYFKLQTRTRTRGKKTLRTISSTGANQAHLDLPS